MKPYENFQVALYFTTRCIDSISSARSLDEQFGFFRKNLVCSKVYLETYRDDRTIPKEKLCALREYFQGLGIRVSGGITITNLERVPYDPMLENGEDDGSGGTILNGESTEQTDPGHKKAVRTFCYTNEQQRQKLKGVVEYTAGIFDEVILDDFFFNTCTCPECIRAKGGKTWERFRLDLMKEVSENIVVGPAKAVNPNVNMIIKYPNWSEAYQQNGYNPRQQAKIFDQVYTGTETRDPAHSPQHIPRYASYSLMRWLEQVKPGGNGGGWLDPLDSIQNPGFFLEQAYLTLFAKGRELTLFCYSWLIDTVQIPMLGFALGRLDGVLGKLGEPCGIPVYEPYDASGEGHLYNFLGMVGLPLAPTPHFPEDSSPLLLTQNSSKDVHVMEKAVDFLQRGGRLCITSGFLKAMSGKGVEEIAFACPTGRSVKGHTFFVSAGKCRFDDFIGSQFAVSVPQIDSMTGSASEIVSLSTHEHQFPLLTKSSYGPGEVFLLTIPDDYAELYRYPAEVLSTIRAFVTGSLGIYFEGKAKISLFLYDNDTFILESFRDNYANVKVHVAGEDAVLIHLRTGAVWQPSERGSGESVFRFRIDPIQYEAFQIHRRAQKG